MARVGYYWTRRAAACVWERAAPSRDSAVTSGREAALVIHIRSSLINAALCPNWTARSTITAPLPPSLHKCVSVCSVYLRCVQRSVCVCVCVCACVCVKCVPRCGSCLAHRQPRPPPHLVASLRIRSCSPWSSHGRFGEELIRAEGDEDADPRPGGGAALLVFLGRSSRRIPQSNQHR